MKFRNYLSWTIFLVLLIWGPINHSWPAWFLIRACYLIFIPIAVWFILDRLWKYYEPNDNLETILARILSGIISILLITIAIFESKSKHHVVGEYLIRTRDGMEEVGENIILPGPDWTNVIISVGFALLFLWHCIFGIGTKKAEK